MNFTNYSDLYLFIADYLPNYYSRNDVLESDILFRFLTNEEINEYDKKWIKEEYGNDINAIKHRCIDLDKKFVEESLENYYKKF